MVHELIHRNINPSSLSLMRHMTSPAMDGTHASFLSCSRCARPEEQLCTSHACVGVELSELEDILTAGG